MGWASMLKRRLFCHRKLINITKYYVRMSALGIGVEVEKRDNIMYVKFRRRLSRMTVNH